MRIIGIALSLLMLLLLSGCGSGKGYKIELYPGDEQIAVNDPLFVDGVPAGKIEALLMNNGQRLALVRVTDNSKLERFRDGIYRGSQRGQINLMTNNVNLGSAPLQEASVITRGGLTETIYEYRATLNVIGIAVCLVAILIFAFRAFFKVFLIILTLGLAVVLAWISHPLAVPYVQQYYVHLQAQTAEPSPAAEQHDKPLIAEAGPADPGSSFENQVNNLLVKKPDPRAVAFGILTFVYFVILTLVLGRALGGVGRKTG